MDGSRIKREETAGAIQIIDGKPRKQARGRVDYTLRVKANLEAQPVAVALIEAKAEHQLATGSGKTFIAVHLLKHIADAGQLKDEIVMGEYKAKALSL